MASTLTKTVPRQALRFRVPLQLAKRNEGDPAGEFPIKMLARSAEPIEHWYWGKVAHDLSGMKLRKESLPLDYCHDPYQIIGVADKFSTTSDGLVVEGKLVSAFAGDRVDELQKKSASGVPYEASIDFYGASKFEQVLPNQVAEVNGRQFEGPGIIVREWTLNAVAVCPLGADANTRSQFAAGEPDEVVVSFLTPKGSAMTKEDKPVESPEAAFEARLQKFVTRFGETNGPKWALAKKSYEEALELHAEALATQLKAAGETHKAALAAEMEKHAAELKAQTDQVAALETKLAAVNRGEPAPVSGGDADKPQPASLMAKVGDPIAKFAAGLKLPGRK